MLERSTPKRAATNEAAPSAKAPKARKAAVERAQLTPEDWVRAGAELLVDRSIDAVRVDVIAKILNVTRGSFYWHFKDREDLLNRVLLAWQDQQTEQIIARYRKQGIQAETLIRELVELPFHGRAAIKGASVELAIRAWARRDEMARRVVDAVDAKRLVYLKECFAELGFAAADAKSRAFVLYCYMQSESLFRNQGTAQDKQQRQKFVGDTLLAGR